MTPWLLDTAISETARDLAYGHWPVPWESLAGWQRNWAMAEAAVSEMRRAEASL